MSLIAADPLRCRHFSHTKQAQCKGLRWGDSVNYCPQHTCPVCLQKKFAFQLRCVECGGKNPVPRVGCRLHSVCVAHEGKKLSGHVVPVVYSYRGGPPAGLFVMERFGRYRNRLNVAGGKGDLGETCLLSEMRRETREEMKWDIQCEDISRLFLKENSQFRHVVFRGTVVFVALLQPGTRRSEFNTTIKLAMEDPQLPSCQKEVSKVEWVDFQGNCVSCPGDAISEFAQGVLQLINLEHQQGTLL